MTELEAAPLSRACKRFRILVIEDHHDCADSMRMVLELRGHLVTVAYDGEDGLQMAKDWQPDIVLCDIGMPGMDGYRVAAQLRTAPGTAAACLIAVSGYPEQSPTSERMVFDHYLLKPVDPSHLEYLFFAGKRA